MSSNSWQNLRNQSRLGFGERKRMVMVDHAGKPPRTVDFISVADVYASKFRDPQRQS